MTAINLWLDDTFTKHADLDAALTAFAKQPYDLDECWVRDPEFQTVSVWSHAEMELLWVQREAEIAAEKRAEAQDHARVGAL